MSSFGVSVIVDPKKLLNEESDSDFERREVYTTSLLGAIADLYSNIWWEL